MKECCWIPGQQWDDLCDEDDEVEAICLDLEDQFEVLFNEKLEKEQKREELP